MSSLSWLYGILQGHKIDTDGMSPKEAFDKLDELQKSGKLTDEEKKTCDIRRGNAKSNSPSAEAQKKPPTKKVVKVSMDAEVQKQLDAAKTPKERQQIAFRYIMDNLRGQYTASDGRTVAIERVGADKLTYHDNQEKLRVCPALADMIRAGEYDHSARGEDKPNKKFEEFVYYRVRIKLGDDIYFGMLNIGVRKDGSSTLYDLRPFHKEKAK